MTTLGWSILRHEKLVVISGLGIMDLPFIMSYARAMQEGGATGYCKLFDLRQADIQLSGDDLSALGTFTRRPSTTPPGPIAILVGKDPPPLMLDMAVLLKQRVGTSRRFRLFTDEREARRWLAAVSA